MCRYKFHHYPGCGHIATFGMESCPDILVSMRQHKSEMYCEKSVFTHDLVFGNDANDCGKCKAEPSVGRNPPDDSDWQYTELEGTDLVSKGYPFSGTAPVNLGSVAERALSTMRCVLHRCLPMDFSYEPSCASVGSDDGQRKMDAGNAPLYVDPSELQASPSCVESPQHSPVELSASREIDPLKPAKESCAPVTPSDSLAFLSEPNAGDPFLTDSKRQRKRPAPIITNIPVDTDACVAPRVTPSPELSNAQDDAISERTPLPSPRFKVPEYTKPRSDPVDFDDAQSPFGTRQIDFTYEPWEEMPDESPVVKFPNKAADFYQSPVSNQELTPTGSEESNLDCDDFELIDPSDDRESGQGSRVGREVSYFSDDSDSDSNSDDILRNEDEDSMDNTDAEASKEPSKEYPVMQPYFDSYNYGMFWGPKRQGSDTTPKGKTTDNPMIAPKGVRSEPEAKLQAFIEEWSMPLHAAPQAPKKRYSEFTEWIQSLRDARRKNIAQAPSEGTLVFGASEETYSSLPRGRLPTPPGPARSPLIPTYPVNQDRAPQEPEDVPPAKNSPWVPPRYRISPPLKSVEGVTKPTYAHRRSSSPPSPDKSFTKSSAWSILLSEMLPGCDVYW
ncbi:uncharacterized protein LDX57_011638 [Aspergillus melleus]|uniref:uncharacterized protein n=1 Tax=Aspergillus melleus TaxID=138277 RepID=UPI001E8DC4D9|nr:uncharacterized protein LDX57_011638 [Aspergillus melleus]KAH8434002.1 hypothetical protein LDX57_011638 [Aspergillus melleus]